MWLEYPAPEAAREPRHGHNTSPDAFPSFETDTILLESPQLKVNRTMSLGADPDGLDELTSLMQREFFPSPSSPPPPTPYSYNRIPSDRRIIRLLTLFPPESPSSSPTFSQPLRGRLDYAPLAFAPTYDALSYAWGSTEKPFTIRIAPSSSSSSSSSFYLPITASVDAALRRLRDNSRIRRAGGWKLWIDAICIDQSDDVEKSGQVGLMSDIFSAAERVLCWIGEDDEIRSLDNGGEGGGGDRMAKATFDLMFELSGASFAGFSTAGERMDEFMASKGAPPKGHGTWTAVRNFFMRPWFRRGWVLQEVYFARKAVILCGDEHVELWDIASGVEAVLDHDLLGWGLGKVLSTVETAGLISFRALLTQMMAKTPASWLGHELGYFTNNDRKGSHYDTVEQTLRLMGIPLPLVVDNYRAVSNMLGLSYRYHPDDAETLFTLYLGALGVEATFNRLPLHFLIGTYPYCTTTDPRDRFFALLSMSLEKDAPALRVNYVESTESIQLRYARYFLLESRDAQGLRSKNILTFGGTSNGRVSAGLPSWVPNFVTVKSEDDEAMLVTTWISQAPYHAAAESETKHCSVIDQLGEIVVVGNMVDVVSHLVYNPMSQDNDHCDKFSRYFAEVDRIIDRNEPYPISPGESRVEVMWRTLIGNITTEMGTPSRNYESLYHRHRLLLEAGVMLDPYIWGSDQRAIMNDWGKVWSMLVGAGYMLCETGAGFIGLVPQGVEVGDSICVILGENMPLLLRLCDGKQEKYRLMGSCYIHGIMKGEAMVSKDWMERDFHLV